MAKRVETTSLQFEVSINGERKVLKMIKDVRKERRTIIKQLETQSLTQEEYNQKIVELKKLDAILAGHRKKIRGVADETKKSGNAFSQFSNLAKKAFAPLLAFQGFGFLKDVVGKLFDTAAQLEQFEIKTQQVFGEARSQVRDFAEQNARDMGLTVREYENAAAAAGDLLVPIGFQQEEAAKTSSEIINLSGALSEWTGGQKDSKEVSEILTKALLGEREQLKSLGISINEADVKQRLAIKGQEKFTGNALKQAKAMATLKLITEKSTDAQKAYAKNTGNLVRQQARIAAFAKTIRDRFTTLLIPAFASAAEKVVGLFNSFDKLADPAAAATREFKDQKAKVEELEKGLTPLLDRYDELNGKTELSADEQDELGKIIAKVGEIVPSAITQFDEYGNALEINAGKARSFLDTQRAILKVRNKDAIKEQTKSLENLKEEYEALTNFLNNDTFAAYDGIIKKGGELFKRQVQGLNTTRKAQALSADETKRIFGNYYNQLETLQEKILGTQGILNELTAGELFPELSSPGPEDDPVIQYEKLKLAELKKLAAEGNDQAKAELERRRKLFADEAEKQKKEEEAAQKAIEDLRIAVMEDGTEKQIAELKLRAERDIEQAKGNAEKVREQTRLINEKLEQDIAEVKAAGREQIRAAEEKALDDRIKARQEAAELEILLLEGSEEQQAKKALEIRKKTNQELIKLEEQLAQKRIDALDDQSDEEVARINQAKNLRIQKIKSDEVKAIEKVEEDSFQRRLKELEDYHQKKNVEITQQVLDEVDAGKGIEDAEKRVQERLLEEFKRYLEARKKLLEENGLEPTEEEQQLLDLDIEGFKSKIQEAANEKDKLFQGIAEAADHAGQAISQLIIDVPAQRAKESYDKQLSALDRAKRKELELAGDSAEKREEIEQRFAIRRARIERNYRKEQKKLAVKQAAIDIALTALKALATPPAPNVPAAALATGLGLLQLAVIQATQFRKGGLLPGKGGVPEGPSHQNGHLYLIDGRTGQVRGLAEGGEPILSKETYKNNKPVVDRLLQASQHEGGRRVDPEEFHYIMDRSSGKMVGTLENGRAFISFSTGSQKDPTFSLGGMLPSYKIHRPSPTYYQEGGFFEAPSTDFTQEVIDNTRSSSETIMLTEKIEELTGAFRQGKYVLVTEKEMEMLNELRDDMEADRLRRQSV